MTRVRTDRLPPANRVIRAAGVDDAPFVRKRGAAVTVLAALCANTRFDSLLATRVRAFGWGATEAIAELVRGSKFWPQLHVVLLDGIAVGGLNVVDLPALSAAVERPCIAVMRRAPDLEAMERAIRAYPRAEQRLALLRAAGPVIEQGRWVFQVQGGAESLAVEALERLTDTGNVPEPLRLAHRIGSGWVLGASGRRA
ncbi:MAG: DUF99 family protein [Polyangiales bacterium]